MFFKLEIICFVIIFWLYLNKAEEDFYKLLGVSKTADNREIRKAFKELAVKLHPDKNQDDPDADSKFILLTRAYETLKDPEARKLYDLYGDTKPSDGNQKEKYQSYNYYKDEFGIYDNDPLIVTLSAHDFELNINDPNAAWFVNFYSPQCWHCHELAPTWRQLSNELEGVIRTGAVNCHEDWQLCVQLNIQEFPTLIFFNKDNHLYDGQVYRGFRTVEKMEEHVLQNLNLQVERITNEKWIDSQYNQVEWILFLCGENDGTCPETKSILKVTAMLDGLVRVGIVNNPELCSEINAEYLQRPVTFWQLTNEEIKVEEDSIIPVTEKVPKKVVTHILDGFDSQDLVKQVLSYLPDLKSLHQEDFQDMRTRLRLGDNTPWLICFYLGGATELDLKFKHIPALLPQMNIGKVHCARNAELCGSLHISRYPTWAILKAGGAFEVHHGKDSIHDVANFARDSSLATNLHALSPADVKNIIKEGEPWFIDWYAPWCPPCQRLMPELRRASIHFTPETVQFGTVDCTLHSSFCRQNGIRSYPSTAFYNGSKVKNFHGVLQEQSIVDFVTDMVNPIIVELDPETFIKTMSKKPSTELWIVNFYAMWCGPCQKFHPDYRNLARTLSFVEGLHLAEVDCVVYSEFCVEQDVRTFPTLRLYPFGTEGMNTIAPYHGHLDGFSFKTWVLGFLHSPVMELTTKEFEEQIMTEYTPEQPWLIDFYTPWCSHCEYLEPEFKIVAQKLEGQVRCAKVNCDINIDLCRSHRISAYPTIVLYMTSELRYEIDSQKSEYIVEKVNHIVSTHKLLPKNIVHDEF